MSNVRELHDKAMQLAQLALIARHDQEWEEAKSLARQSYEYEAQAAELIPKDKSSEPTRSILYRSAASLAYQCEEFGIAQRLIAKGLSGYPPPQIEQELKELDEQVKRAYFVKVFSPAFKGPKHTALDKDVPKVINEEEENQDSKISM
jgi:hypothetical protein